ncbi:uncharacterized protein AKAME5_000449600, partial [Lates japonicus]
MISALCTTRGRLLGRATDCRQETEVCGAVGCGGCISLWARCARHGEPGDRGRQVGEETSAADPAISHGQCCGKTGWCVSRVWRAGRASVGGREIRPQDRILRTAVPDMDRETQDQYLVVLQAKDMGGHLGGLSGTTTITVRLSDVNDNP